jgi:SH3 domain protein
MKMDYNQLFRSLSLFALLTFSSFAIAKPAYISPSLQVGLHTSAALDSPIKEMISSGTPVTILKKNKSFTQIKTSNGQSGWVKNQFITDEQPAIIKLKKLQELVPELEKKLAAATNQQSTLDLEMQSSNAEMKDKFDEYEETIANLKAEIEAWEQLDSQSKDNKNQRLIDQNRLLKERLIEVIEVATGEEVEASKFSLSVPEVVLNDEDANLHPLLRLFKRDYLVHAIVAGIGFLLGLFIMDIINRRRHGGYRI